MSSLSFQDAFFLRAESATSLAHVAALMIFRPPAGARADYLRRLAAKFGRVSQRWPVLTLKLRQPASSSNLAWETASDFDPADHVFHYALPAPGRTSDLLRLVEHAHEQLLDRSRPLWQVHLIEGLRGGRFAVYFKVHHALMDGVAGLQMIVRMLSTDPQCRTLGGCADPLPARAHEKATILQALTDSVRMLAEQSGALPDAVSMLARLGWNNMAGSKESALPPFAAPRTLLNGEIDARRRIVTCELPINRLRAIGKRHGGTINDVLIAICGAALRQYLLDQWQLPRRSLDAGLPVAVKVQGDDSGNRLGFIICPFATEQRDPVRRLQRVIRATRKAKADIGHLSPTATQDLATLVMLPFLLMSVTHTSQRFPPVFNTIVSNVPGPAQPLFLDRSRLEHIYPVSVITDGLALNITAISYAGKLCIAMTSCPKGQPDIGSLGKRIRLAYRELLATV